MMRRSTTAHHNITNHHDQHPETNQRKTTTVWGHIERHGRCERLCGGVIRIFEDTQSFGDPYRYSFPYVMRDENTIELHGIVGRAPTPSEGRAMLEVCRRAGWRVVRERKAGCRLGLREITRPFKDKG